MISGILPIPESGFPRMARQPRETRRRRCIMTSDSEWQMITSLAGRAGMSNSRFLVERALESRDTEPSSGFPPEVRRRLALALLVLARVEEKRLADAGAAAVWDSLTAEENARLDAEVLLDGGSAGDG
ncbi:MAG: hypothetical protein OXI81_18910 [Paracoccaceae bacterium]|nr:hypothetical protein [Paracoccaceae bacterium]